MYVINHNQPPPNYSQYCSTNTFSRKPSCAQISAYIVIISDVIIYYLCIHVLNPNWILFAFYTFSLLLLIVSTAVASCSDPTDRTVYDYKWSKYNKQQFNAKISDLYYCQYCDSYCKQASKHCRICNRCVDNFDHHCIWINNCIGSNNYKSFMVMIISTLCHMIIFLTGASIISAMSDITDAQKIGRAIPVWILIPFMSVLGFLLITLIILHIYLNCRDLTTYLFMIQRRNKVKQQEQEKLKVQSKIKQLNFQNVENSIQKISIRNKVQNQQICNKNNDNNNNDEKDNDNKNNDNDNGRGVFQQQSANSNSIIKQSKHNMRQQISNMRQQVSNMRQSNMRQSRSLMRQSKLSRSIKFLMGGAQVDDPLRTPKQRKK